MEERKDRKRKTETIFLENEEQQDQHCQKGNLHRKKEKILKRKEKAEASPDSQQTSIISSRGEDAVSKQRRKEKRAKKLLYKQEGDDTVEDPRAKNAKNLIAEEEKIFEECSGNHLCAEEVLIEDKKKAKKAKKTRNSLCKLKADEPVQEGSNNSVCGNDFAFSEAQKQVKKAKKSQILPSKLERDEAQEDPSNKTGGSTECLTHGKEQTTPRVSNCSSETMLGNWDPSPEGNWQDKEKKKKKKKKKKKRVSFQDQIMDIDRSQVVDAPQEETLPVSENIGNKDLNPEGNWQDKEKKKKKRVSFQGQIVDTGRSQVVDAREEEPLPVSENTKDDVNEIWGTRFTLEEDEILKDAILKYIKEKGWDEEEGIDKVLNCKKHKEAYNCWSDIKMYLPNRPREAVRYRAHLLLEKGTHLGHWSKEEEDFLKSLQEKHGRKWKEFSSMLGRSRHCIKEKWRSLKRQKGRGVWTQDELQHLSGMVHKCLRMKAVLGKTKEKKDRHILRDDINWELIADEIGTHGHGACCGKWYYNLTSSMVAAGIWVNEDDFFLLKSLLESGACAEEEVEWDSLLDYRSGHTCLTRWKQMSKHLGENRTRQFLEKLDILAHRYAPELLKTSTEDGSINEKTSAESA